VQVYRSHPLDTRNESMTHALVIVHGGGRNPNRSFPLAIELASRAQALEHTIVVLPRFASNDGGVCVDALEDDEANWGCEANNGWAAGGTGRNVSTRTTYDVMDDLVRRLVRREVFPNLTHIVIAGHSAGGQFVTRYSMANTVHETAGVRIRYVVSNPASYAYPDGRRPAATGAPDAGCRIYDDWPYGLKDRQAYSLRLTEDRLRTQLASRPVTYLLGELDNQSGAGLDVTCAGMVQGPSRLVRGLTFARHVNETYGAHHAVLVVRGCGHDERCMFQAPESQRLLFPKD
jgi:pimeloyl-ACP methyl ester carboxylesterase